MSAAARRIPARYVLPLLDHLRETGADVQAMLLDSCLDPAALTARGATLKPAEVDALVEATARLTGRTDLGFEMGRRIKPTTHEMLGWGMLSCRNLDQVARLVARHYHLMNETTRMRYRRLADGPGEVIYTPAIGMPHRTLHFYLEMLAAAHANQVQLLLGAHTGPHTITLSMPEPPHAARYRELAPAQFHFDPQALPSVHAVMDARMLDRLLPLADPRVVADVDARLSQLGQRPGSGDEGWGDYVAMMLRQAQGELLTLDDVARHVQLSARTIDRHLKKEGLQFRDLAQQVRFERACERLAEPSVTVAQVAAELGFSDAANFSRAFRRVLGVAPGEYQRTLLSARRP